MALKQLHTLISLFKECPKKQISYVSLLGQIPWEALLNIYLSSTRGLLPHLILRINFPTFSCGYGIYLSGYTMIVGKFNIARSQGHKAVPHGKIPQPAHENAL